MTKNKMNEFALLFRMDITTKEARPSPEQMEAYLTRWHDWMDSIATQNKLASGNHFSVEGNVIKKDNAVTKGPHTANKMSVAGYIIINAKDFDEAVKIAKDCPILQGEGTSVEVRKVVAM